MCAIWKSLVQSVGFLAVIALVVPAVALGQESKTNGKAKVPVATAAEEAEFAKLVTRKGSILKKLDTLEEQAMAAREKNDDETFQKIARQYQATDAEFKQEVGPRLIVLAPKVYEKDPKNIDAAEVVIASAIKENKYRQVIEMVKTATEGGGKSAPLLTFLGVSQFATHDFANAQKNLTAARDADRKVFPIMGAPYLEACPEYIDLWKKEQEIRAKEKQAADLPQVTFKTSKGDISFELFENEAPNTVANFISLIEKKKYDGVKFHRVLPNFMAQGGDPNTLDDDPQNDGQGGPGYTIPCECYNENARMHFQGSLSMAHAGKDTGGSQFFITHLPTPHLNPGVVKPRNGEKAVAEDRPTLKGHTVFGRVIQGLEVALALRVGDEIISAKVVRKRNHEYKPETIAKSGFPKSGKKVK